MKKELKAGRVDDVVARAKQKKRNSVWFARFELFSFVYFICLFKKNVSNVPEKGNAPVPLSIRYFISVS